MLIIRIGYPLLSVLFFFALTGNTLAQDSLDAPQIADLFRNPKKIQWVKHYEGRMDDMNDIGLSLGFDGNKCRGFIIYRSSRERFKVEGVLDGNDLDLKELNDDGEVVGAMEGRTNKTHAAIKAHWHNADKSRGGFLDLEEVSRLRPYGDPCGENKWVRTYQGLLRGAAVRVLLQQNTPYDLVGVVYFEGDGRSMALRGGMEGESRLRVALVNDLEQVEGYLKCSINRGDQKMSGHWVESSGDQHFINLKMTQHLTVGCMEYRDFRTSYSAIYPRSNNKAFDTFVQGQIEDWREDCQAHVLAEKQKSPKPKAEERDGSHANGWFQMEHLSDKIVSGYLVLDKSWKAENRDTCFNYDLASGEPFGLGDVFREGVDYHGILRRKVVARLRFAALYSMPEYREWLEKEAEFSCFSIRDDGIRYSTAFHPIYGRQGITIPFREIRQYLRDESPIAHLLVN